MSTNDRNKEELRIGRLMAEGLQDLAADTPCLSEEQMDALMAGTLPEVERDAALSHISGCAVCRHALVVAQRMAKVDLQEAPKHIRPAWNYIVPLSLAATLVLAIGLYRLVPKGGESPLPGMPVNKPPADQVAKVEPPAPPPQVTQPAKESAVRRKPTMTDRDDLFAMADNLGKSVQGKVLNIPFSSANQPGFASDGAAEANRFHAGFAAFSLVVACDANDPVLIRRAFVSLDERLQLLDLPKNASEKIAHLRTALEGNTFVPTASKEMVRSVSAVLANIFHDDLYLQLGAWTAAVRFSTQIKNPDFLKDKGFTSKLAAAEKLEKPRGVAKKVAEIKKILAGNLDDNAWSNLESLADDIQKRF